MSDPYDGFMGFYPLYKMFCGPCQQQKRWWTCFSAIQAREIQHYWFKQLVLAIKKGKEGIQVPGREQEMWVLYGIGLEIEVVSYSSTSVLKFGESIKIYLFFIWHHEQILWVLQSVSSFVNLLWTVSKTENVEFNLYSSIFLVFIYESQVIGQGKSS